MKQSEKYVGTICQHDHLGKVSVDSIHKNSRVLVDVTVIDRGKGYDPITETYKGIKTKGGWTRGENHQFGDKDVIHIKELTIIN